ncbi:MAG TPA: hypothetical protein VFZ61_32145, partial [Polyangiales bacterium]
LSTPGMLMRRFASLCLSSLALLSWTGCGDEPEPVVVGGGGGVTQDSGSPVNTGCPEISTESCNCPDGSSGSRACSSGTWTSCNCGSPSVPVTTVGACKAGHYEGDFSGFYRSGFILGAPIPVFALDISLEPALKFTLEEKVGGDAEFPTYVISDGYIKGTANGLFPFEAKLTGTLDCRTKTLTGQMDGGYSILLPLGLNQGVFIGPVMGSYNSDDHSFTSGTWDLEEDDSLGISVVGDPGGEGTWTAKWVSPP